MTVNFYSGNYTYYPDQYSTRTATRQVPYQATRQVPYKETVQTPVNTIKYNLYFNRFSINSSGAPHRLRTYISSFDTMKSARDSALALSRTDTYRDQAYDIQEVTRTTYKSEIVTKYRTETYTAYRTESYQEQYLSRAAYSSTSVTGLTTSGTTGAIDSTYSGRILVSTDDTNYTYYSDTSLNGLLTTTSKTVYTAILSEPGSTLGLTNGTSYTKSAIEAKVAEYNTAQGISVERVELAKVVSYLNNLRDTGINNISARYNEFYDTGTRYYQEVKAIVAQA